MLYGITLTCASSSVYFDTARGLLCSAVAPLLAHVFLSTQNRLNKLVLRKVILTGWGGREQGADRTHACTVGHDKVLDLPWIRKIGQRKVPLKGWVCFCC